jgi:hypothetical protein
MQRAPGCSGRIEKLTMSLLSKFVAEENATTLYVAQSRLRKQEPRAAL